MKFLLGVAIGVSLVASAFSQLHDPYVASVANIYQQVKQRNDDQAIKYFATHMPKGGDLHIHLTGSLYPTFMINTAQQHADMPWCYHVDSQKIYNDNACLADGGEWMASSQADYKQMQEAWSLQDFTYSAPLYGHDHFFSVFSKITQLSNYLPYWTEYVRNLLQQARAEHLDYLELQVRPNGDDTAKTNIEWYAENAMTTFPSSADQLDMAVVKAKIKELDAANINANYVQPSVIKPLQGILNAIYHNPHAKAPAEQTRFQYYAVRTETPRQVFANLYAGFLAVKDAPDVVVGLNLVAPEDNQVAVHDYALHMKMFGLLRQYFQQKYHVDVHYSLHAGELTNLIAKQKDLHSHVEQAIDIANADRIGHGVDIQTELKYHPDLLKQLKQKNKLVEINLSSNADILGVCDGSTTEKCYEPHPIMTFVQAGVPIVLSTDDEGIEMTDLNHEYAIAMKRYPLTYAQMKRADRNSLQYSFLPGQSLWQKKYTQMNAACSNDNPYGLRVTSNRCQQFLNQNLKARLQWHLEAQFSLFEQKVLRNNILN